MKLIKNTKGETVMETVIALTILAVGLTMSSALIATSLRNINISKNRVIAVNIAREGIEAVRNIRDTNWLKYSGRRRICWNHLPGDFITETCEGDSPIGADGYVVYKSEDHRWRLHAIDDADDFDESVLYTVDIDTYVDTDKDGDKLNDSDMYNHLPEEGGGDAMGRDHAAETSFSRVIKIEYLRNNGEVVDKAIWDTLDLTQRSALNRMRITSTVSWVRGGIEQDVELITHITDYLGRDNLGS